MRWDDPKPLLAIASLGLVSLLAWRDIDNTSPGPLTTPHAGSSELTGPNSCEACHGDSPAELHTACAQCHAVIGTQVAAGMGFHGSLDAGEVRRCGNCHIEHHGDEVQLVSELAFRRAGVQDPSQFDHAHVEFGLVGRHDALTCVECHANADARFLPAGEPRFFGARQDCASCHEDPHEGRFASSCATCHGQERPFAEYASFVHGDAFPLVGAHGRPGCIDCHADGSGHSIADLAGDRTKPTTRACADCHDSPHAVSFVTGVAAAAGLKPSTSCVLCHDATQGNFTEGATVTAEQHAAAGFPLDSPHAELECSACHSGTGGAFTRRYAGRTPDDCHACHTSPHGEQFADGPFDGRDCLACHSREHFEPTTFDVRLHARTAFPLEGSHTTVDCVECHTRPAEGTATRFGEAPTACEGCHADPHDGLLVVQADESGCATCHTTTTFDEADRQAFAHDTRTGFTLRGAHGRARCESCHLPTLDPDHRGRTFGRVADVFPGPPGRCATCHTSVHRDAFSAVQEGCMRCHNEERFRPHSFTRFPHGEFTGFPIDGAHDAVRCVACHGPNKRLSRSFGFVSEHLPGPPERCVTCHTDVHAGRFDSPGRPEFVEGRSDCARCHSTDSFELHAGDRFDHGLWTDYALEGPHARADCFACHTQGGITGSDRGLGPARGDSCSDCHLDPHAGQFRDGAVTDCAACHTLVVDFRVDDFDHDARTRFALDDTHAQLDCAACHQPWPLAGGGEVVRYKPLGTLCGDCHAPGTTGTGDGR